MEKEGFFLCFLLLEISNIPKTKKKDSMKNTKKNERKQFARIYQMKESVEFVVHLYDRIVL